jgi:predicted SprT family Zn-dependent metalloprotease
VTIPKKFDLMGTTIEVEYNADMMFDDNAMGQANYRRNKIFIAPNTSTFKMNKEQLEQVFLHELVHWIFYQLKHDDLQKDEELVDQFAELLHQTLKTMEGDFLAPAGMTDGGAIQ